jgi:hypothetical protein
MHRACPIPEEHPVTEQLTRRRSIPALTHSVGAETCRLGMVGGPPFGESFQRKRSAQASGGGDRPAPWPRSRQDDGKASARGARACQLRPLR